MASGFALACINVCFVIIELVSTFLFDAFVLSVMYRYTCLFIPRQPLSLGRRHLFLEFFPMNLLLSYESILRHERQQFRKGLGKIFPAILILQLDHVQESFIVQAIIFH